MTRIAIIGGGNMGEALLAGLLAAGRPVKDLVVAERYGDRARQLSEKYSVLVTSVADAVENASIVIVAVKPQDVDAVVDEFAKSVTAAAGDSAEQVLVTIVAGLTTGYVESKLPAGAAVVRDPWGRTVFAAGTPRPLMLASVTKLATVSAALSADPSLPVGPVAAILRPSDNAKAQALSNVLGSGSRTLGARRAADHAAALGAAWQVVDGSGLSRGNRAPAGEVADLLLGIRDEPAFRTLFRGLPVAGRTGTLEWRMRGTSAAGRVRAKTGTYDVWRASSLAGYFWPAGAGLSPERAFVVVSLENGVPPYRARPVQDAVAAALTARGALTPPAATGG